MPGTLAGVLAQAERYGPAPREALVPSYNAKPNASRRGHEAFGMEFPTAHRAGELARAAAPSVTDEDRRSTHDDGSRAPQGPRSMTAIPPDAAGAIDVVDAAVGMASQE